MVESEPLPEVAVTTIEYVPAGVPVAGLSDGAVGPGIPPQATKPEAITSNETSKNCGANRRTRPLRTRRPSHMSTIARAAKYSEGQCGEGARGVLIGGTAECAIVAIESITVVAPLPAGIIAKGEKEGVAPDGNPDTVNVTEFAVVPFEGVTIKL